MSFCHIHGQYEDYFNRGCPSCQRSEEVARHAEWELKEAVSKAAHDRANPGDYDCPHCKYRTLRADATRCPLCQGVIGGDYWKSIRAWEKAKEEIEAAASKAAAEQLKVLNEKAAAEFVRTAPERAAAEARRAAEAQRTRRSKASKEMADRGGLIGASIGAIVIGFSGCASCLNHPFVPGDFPLTPFNLITGLVLGAIGGAAIGAIIGFAIGQTQE